MCLQVFPLQSGVEGQSNTNVGWTRKQCPSSLSPYLCFFYVFRAEGQDAATAFEPTTSGADDTSGGGGYRISRASSPYTQ